jgi:hypothetical protein
VKLGWAIAIGLLAGAALAWWLSAPEDRFNPFAGPRGGAADRPASSPGDASGAVTVLYRWRDAQGVLHVSQQPPGDGQPYERFTISPEQNVVNLGPPPED